MVKSHFLTGKFHFLMVKSNFWWFNPHFYMVKSPCLLPFLDVSPAALPAQRAYSPPRCPSRPVHWTANSPDGPWRLIGPQCRKVKLITGFWGQKQRTLGWIFGSGVDMKIIIHPRKSQKRECIKLIWSNQYIVAKIGFKSTDVRCFLWSKWNLGQPHPNSGMVTTHRYTHVYTQYLISTNPSGLFQLSSFASPVLKVFHAIYQKNCHKLPARTWSKSVLGPFRARTKIEHSCGIRMDLTTCQSIALGEHWYLDPIFLQFLF